MITPTIPEIVNDFEAHKNEIFSIPGNIIVDDRLIDYNRYSRLDTPADILPHLISVSKLRTLSTSSIFAKERLLQISTLWKLICKIPNCASFSIFSEWKDVSEHYFGTDQEYPFLKRVNSIFGTSMFVETQELMNYLEFPEVWAMLAIKAKQLTLLN